MNGADKTYSLTKAAARPPVPAVTPKRRPAGARRPESDLRANLNTLLESRWLIAGMTSCAVAMAVLYVLVAPRAYESNLLVYVEEPTPKAELNALDEADAMFDTKKAAAGEIELLRSRMVVLAALDKLHMYVEVTPRYFPLVGAWYAARHRTTLAAPGLFGWGGYVWGGERAEVATFEVPANWLNREFTLTARGHDRFSVTGPDGFVAEGEAGLRFQFATPEGPLMLEVTRLAARPGAQFLLRRHSPLSNAEAVQKALRVTEQEKQSGIIRAKLVGEDPQRVHQVLTEIGKEYMRQDRVRKSEQAKRSLAFLEQALPTLKRTLDQAEEHYNRFRIENGIVDLGLETQTSLQELAATRTRRSELSQKRTLLLARFSPAHPAILVLDRQRQQLDQRLARLTQRLQQLPGLEQEQARLLRDIQVNNDLYAALSKTAQQLRLLWAGRISNVRLIDEPMPSEKPVSPRIPLIIMMSTMIGLFSGVVTAFARKSMRGGIEEPRQLERLFGRGTVYATIPHSRAEEKQRRMASENDAPPPLLARVQPFDPAIESLRAFRCALQFALCGFKNNVVMLTGATRGAGTSFVCANLAAVVAASRKRVLLIDADLRNGQLHRYFGVPRELGLSKTTSGSTPIHRGVIENLDFIATGTPPRNRSDFLLHLNFSSLLETVGANYDLVLIDTPPVAQAADALVIGRHVGAVFVVARARVTTDAGITESVKRLRHAGLAPQGVLFNAMTPGIGRGWALGHPAARAQLGQPG